MKAIWRICFRKKDSSMNYEIFKRCAALNSEFEIIPSNVKLLSVGIVLNDNGYMKYNGETYITNMVKLKELPEKIQSLFMESKNEMTHSSSSIETNDDKQIVLKTNSSLENLSKVLFEQLQNITDPEEGTDVNQELKKANTVCNIADKLITIVDLSLKAEIFYEKKQRKFKKMYE